MRSSNHKHTHPPTYPCVWMYGANACTAQNPRAVYCFVRTSNWRQSLLLNKGSYQRNERPTYRKWPADNRFPFAPRNILQLSPSAAEFFCFCCRYCCCELPPSELHRSWHQFVVKGLNCWAVPNEVEMQLRLGMSQSSERQASQSYTQDRTKRGVFI